MSGSGDGRAIGQANLVYYGNLFVFCLFQKPTSASSVPSTPQEKKVGINQSVDVYDEDHLA